MNHKKYNCMYRCAIEQKLNKKIRCKDVGWWWINKVIAHFYCTVGEHVTVYEVDYLGKETVLMPDCPGIRCSVAPTRWQKFKKEMAWMWEIQSDFLSPFSHSGCIKFLEGAPIILSGARTVLCIDFWFCIWAKPDSYWSAQTPWRPSRTVWATVLILAGIFDLVLVFILRRKSLIVLVTF